MFLSRGMLSCTARPITNAIIPRPKSYIYDYATWLVLLSAATKYLIYVPASWRPFHCFGENQQSKTVFYLLPGFKAPRLGTRLTICQTIATFLPSARYGRQFHFKVLPTTLVHRCTLLYPGIAKCIERSRSDVDPLTGTVETCITQLTRATSQQR